MGFFKSFSKEFEQDDNFMLEAVKRAGGVFEQWFLQRFSELTNKSGELCFVTDSRTLTNLELPLKTPFGIVLLPLFVVVSWSIMMRTGRN